MKFKYNIMLFNCLICAYAYYFLNKNLVSDEEYDIWMLEIAQNCHKVTIPCKKLIDFEYLKNGTSLFYIRNYPNYIRRQAFNWLRYIE